MIETFIYAILALLFIGVIIYLLSSSKSQNSDNCHKIPDVTHELHIDYIEKNSEKISDRGGKRPAQLKEPRAGGRDNLQLIKGVGKVLEGVLMQSGIYYFEQIANWTDEEARWMDNSISFPGRIEREDWRGQARDLAEGKSTEYSKKFEKK